MLRESWFDDKDKLHIDGYGKLEWADGYRPDNLAELHEVGFFVADNAVVF